MSFLDDCMRMHAAVAPRKCIGRAGSLVLVVVLFWLAPCCGGPTSTPPLPPQAAPHSKETSGCGPVNRAVVALALKGSLVEALKIAKGALEAHPTDANLLNNIGCLLLFALSEASWSRAEEFLRRALQSNGVHAPAMFNYGMLHSARPHSHRHNKKCAAKQLIRAACQLHSSMPATVLTARSILLERCAALPQVVTLPADDADENPAASSISSDDKGIARQSAELYSSGGAQVIAKQDGTDTVMFGVRSETHARVLGPSSALSAHSEASTSGSATRAKVTSASARKQRPNRKRPRVCGRQWGEGGRGKSSWKERILAGIEMGDSVALLLSTTLGKSKCLMASKRTSMVAWIRQHCSASLAPHQIMSTPAKGGGEPLRTDSEEAVRDEILSLVRPLPLPSAAAAQNAGQDVGVSRGSEGSAWRWRSGLPTYSKLASIGEELDLTLPEVRDLIHMSKRVISLDSGGQDRGPESAGETMERFAVYVEKGSNFAMDDEPRQDTATLARDSSAGPQAQREELGEKIVRLQRLRKAAKVMAAEAGRNLPEEGGVMVWGGRRCGRLLTSGGAGFLGTTDVSWRWGGLVRSVAFLGVGRAGVVTGARGIVTAFNGPCKKGRILLSLPDRLRAAAAGNEGTAQRSALAQTVADAGEYVEGVSVAQISAGQRYVLVLLSNTTVLSFGNCHESCHLSCNHRRRGQTLRSRRGTVNYQVAEVVHGLEGKDIVSITAGGAHSMAVSRDGSLWAWGCNVAGQLGDGSVWCSDVPVRVVGIGPSTPETGETADARRVGPRAVKISAGSAHSVAVMDDGRVMTWGCDNCGQLGSGQGVGAWAGVRLLPETVHGLAGVRIVDAAAGTFHTLALSDGGQVYGWGFNRHGQVGDGTNVSTSTPIPVLSAARGIAAGHLHSLALVDSGLASNLSDVAAGGAKGEVAGGLRVMAWGLNHCGQLCDGTRLSRCRPHDSLVAFAACARWHVKIAAGLHASALLVSPSMPLPSTSTRLAQTGCNSTSRRLGLGEVPAWCVAPDRDAPAMFLVQMEEAVGRTNVVGVHALDEPGWWMVGPSLHLPEAREQEQPFSMTLATPDARLASSILIPHAAPSRQGRAVRRQGRGGGDRNELDADEGEWGQSCHAVIAYGVCDDGESANNGVDSESLGQERGRDGTQAQAGVGAGNHVKAAGYYVKSLESGGSWVDGERVTRGAWHRLCPGSAVWLGQDLDQEGMFCFKLLDSGRTWAQVRGETQTREILKQQVMCEAREIPILNREAMFRFKLLDTGRT